jgi:invasion protein IalB
VPAPAATPAPAPAPAPIAAAAPLQPPAGQPGQPQWIKFCSADPASKKNLCMVQQEVFADTGQFIVSAAIRTIQDDPKLQLIVGVPLAMQIQPGVRAQIDQGKQSELKYSICVPPNTCFADTEITADFIKSLKSGGTLTVLSMSASGKPIPFQITLSGFTKAYDGPGVDPNSPTGQAQLDALSQSLKAHADEARQKLIEQQQARPQ